jgi:hypothetical protein
MALKAVLQSLDGVPDEIAKEYKQEGNVYHLDIDNFDEHPAIGALKRAKDHEKSARHAAEDATKELKGKYETLVLERDDMLKGAVAKDDVERLEKSWGEKLKAREDELNGTIGTVQGHLQNLLVENVAQQIAVDISTTPNLLLPHIKARLSADITGDKPGTRVLDAKGEVSALTLDDLKKEFKENSDFASVIIGSKASGGGASGGSGGGGSNDNPWSKQGWSMQAQGEVVKDQGFQAAEQMAKQAGSRIGATHPT